MQKDTKFLIGAFVFTILLIGSLAVLISIKDKKSAEIPTTPVSGIEVTPDNYNLGDVPIKGGIVTREYEIKNTSGRDMELKKIVTSCMCTTASVKVGDKETNFFGMEMSGDGNPLVKVKVKNGDTAKVTVRFDPAAHGPEGVGAFDRIVSLYFDSGIKELTFKGVVVK